MTNCVRGDLNLKQFYSSFNFIELFALCVCVCLCEIIMCNELRFFVLYGLLDLQRIVYCYSALHCTANYKCAIYTSN